MEAPGEAARHVAGPIEVRPARGPDVPEAVQLWGQMMAEHRALDPRLRFAADAPQAVARQMRGSLRDRDTALLVAEGAGRVVGYVMAYRQQRPPGAPVGEFAFVAELFVCPEFRREGTGTRLVRAAMEALRARGARSFELLASGANGATVGFWRSLGFSDYMLLLRADLPGADGEGDRP